MVGLLEEEKEKIDKMKSETQAANFNPEEIPKTVHDDTTHPDENELQSLSTAAQYPGEWVDIPPDESPDLKFTVPVDLNDLQKAACPLCEVEPIMTKHCHCENCKENYVFVARHMLANSVI